MIEVFKTNVRNRHDAGILIELIQRTFDYQVNFDLHDCDRILRVKCATGIVQSDLLIDLLSDAGFEAEILPDEISLAGTNSIHKTVL